MSDGVRRVTASETRRLRQKVLRPNERIDDLVWPHDDAPDTFHAGAFEDGAMIATATLHKEPPPARIADRSQDASAWRLRGMATEPARRGRGYGARLVAACIDHARADGGTLVWCNARVTAARFYEKLGFTTHGDAFELPGIGPHVVMTLRIG